MCKCKNIKIGSYDRQTSMKDPFNTRNRNGGWVCVDTCLVQEIAELWYQGIKTVESCCGHNKTKGYIMVLREDYDRMIGLGYKPDNEWNGNSEKLAIFYPKIGTGWRYPETYQPYQMPIF